MGNPATLGYFAGARGLGGNYQLLPHDHDSWSIALIDGTSHVTGGFHFQWTEVGSAKRLNYSSAAAYKQDWAWIGGGVRAVQDSKVATHQGWHFLNSMGGVFLIPGGLSVGIYGKNFLDREPDSEFPPAFYSGLAYSVPKTMRAYVETSRFFDIPEQDWNFSFSGELIMKEYYLIRGGYFWSRSDGQDKLWSIGGGMQAPKIDFIFAFTQTTRDSKSGYSFELDFRF